MATVPSFICGTHKTTMSLLCKSLTSNSGEMALAGSDSVTKPHLEAGSTSSAVWTHACKLDRAEGPTSVSYISSISPPAANSQVIFHDTKPHGHWHYEYDSVKDGCGIGLPVETAGVHPRTAAAADPAASVPEGQLLHARPHRVEQPPGGVAVASWAKWFC